jgi:hypothetical protein
MVSELLDPNTLTWDIQKVNKNFCDTDVRAICSIPTSRFANDFWAWAKEANGRFTVRSAYKTLIVVLDISTVGSSMGDLRPYWQQLWKMKIPPKVKCF